MYIESNEKSESVSLYVYTYLANKADSESLNKPEMCPAIQRSGTRLELGLK